MRSRVLVVLSALTLSLLLPGTAGARNGPAVAATRAADAAVLAYWTPSRIANAKWRDYVRNDAGKLVPNAKPGGGSGTGNVTGASWPNNGDIEQRSGRILFSSGGSDWICSGSVVANAPGNGYSIILTAGHCVFDGNDGWSYNFLYMPDFDTYPSYDCNTRAPGCWRANLLAAHSSFVPDGFGDDTVNVDYGFARVGSRIAGTGQADLDLATGGYGLLTGLSDNQAIKWAFGYPAEGRYKGKDLVYCKGPTINDPYGATTWGVACNMNGGSSGGPWIYGDDTPATYSDDTKLVSVNSYGYSGLNYMFGPKFTTATANVLNAAINGGGTNADVCAVATTQPNC